MIITTRLPPQICGVGTFSWQLERHWPGETTQHRFLVVNGAAESSVALTRSGIFEFGKDWNALGRALEEAGPVDVLLHYAGRGYQRFGCPAGLVRVVEQWKRKFGNGRLIVFFHELPGRLPITSRHYWLNICSLRIVRRLIKLADVAITNTEEHVRTLKRISGRADIHCLPVASNIENAGRVEESRDPNEFVVFGLPFGRWQTLQAFDSEIRDWQQNGTLTKLHLIGPRDNKFDLRSEALIKSYPNPAMVIRHGEIPAAEVSQLLAHAQFALTTANDLTWSKSSILMACFAHGCVTVSPSRSAVEPLSFAIKPEEVGNLSDVELRSRANAARQWYDANADWKILAAKVSDLIASLPRRDI